MKNERYAYGLLCCRSEQQRFIPMLVRWKRPPICGTVCWDLGILGMSKNAFDWLLRHFRRAITTFQVTQEHIHGQIINSNNCSVRRNIAIPSITTMKSVLFSAFVGTAVLASAAAQSCPITQDELNSFDFSNVLSYCGTCISLE